MTQRSSNKSRDCGQKGMEAGRPTLAAHAHRTQLGVRVKHSMVPSRCCFLSAVLFHRPLSFPPGQATHSTPSAPEDLGSLPDCGPGRPSRQAAESALPSGGSLGKALRSFPGSLGMQSLSQLLQTGSAIVFMKYLNWNSITSTSFVRSDAF